VKTSSIYGAFNARWLEPEDVARSFVPTPSFKSLLHLQHSLLMGPRGCGKTTLLKMLTRRAQGVWQRERVPKEPHWADYRLPDFEAIYIPSDTRWSSELESITRDLAESPIVAERAQRAAVSISAVVEATRVFEGLLVDNQVDATELSKALISYLGIGPSIPSFRHIRLKLGGWIDEIHRDLVKRDSPSIERHLDSIPPAFTAHSISAISRACNIFEEFGPAISPGRWALCFDELEIAPDWLQRELFAALRSADQRLLLKLTWSPVIPTHLTLQQERQQDYTAIRMWHGHALDAKPFCKEFATRFLRGQAASQTLTPKDYFGPSPFAQEETDVDQTYAHGTPVWRAMVQLARQDTTFKEYLIDHDLSPDNPVTDSVTARDESLRKIKPLVLLREAYLKGTDDSTQHRSRKNPLLYYGEDAIYAMSEGNPRLLAGLLNELVDLGTKSGVDGTLSVKPDAQSRVLRSASQRTLTGIKAYPVERGSSRRSLSSLVDKLGTYLHSELVTRNFNADPVGSFFIDEDVSPDIEAQIAVGLLIGAFLHVKSSEADIPIAIVGSRIRLSYMLAPYFRFLFRNYRGMRLSTALRISTATHQLMLRPGG
jgi:hypothetical protein